MISADTWMVNGVQEFFYEFYVTVVDMCKFIGGLVVIRNVRSCILLVENIHA